MKTPSIKLFLIIAGKEKVDHRTRCNLYIYHDF